MADINSLIAEAASAIHSYERSKQVIAQRLAPLRGEDIAAYNSPELRERRLFHPLKQKKLEGRIAGVDSGFIGKKMAAIDLVLIRAVGAVFEYADGMVQNAFYHPGIYQFPLPHLTNTALENDEFACSKSLMRLSEEVNSAREVIEKFSPQYCLIDGSIIPQYQDKPRKDSGINALYTNIVAEFQALYAAAEEKGCELVACVEDSRGSRFRSIIQEVLLPARKLVEENALDNVFDSALLDYMLQKGERTAAFTYTKNIGKHPILMDFEEGWSRNIYGFYLKPSLYDRPLRVEFIHKSGDLTQHADGIGAVVLALSSMHREYAYPSVLIEADLRARLKPEETELVFSRIMDKLGKNIKLRMRRDRRPF